MNPVLKWKLIAGFLLVFIAGGLTGGFIGATHARHLFRAFHSHGLPDRIRDRLERQLDLTPEQSAKITPIIDDTAKKLEEIRTESARRVRATLEESHRQIAPQLTPEQRKKLEEVERKHRKRMHRRELRHSERNERHD